MNALANTFEAIARNADAEVATLLSELIAVVDTGECRDYKDLTVYYCGAIKAAQARQRFAAELAVELAID